MKKTNAPPDVTVHQTETLYLVCPLTRKALRWTESHMDASSWSWKAGAIAADRRLAHKLVDGMTAAGLVVE